MKKLSSIIFCLHVAAFISKALTAKTPPPECTKCGCCVNNTCIDISANNLNCKGGCKDGYYGDRCYNYCDSYYENCARCKKDRSTGYVFSCESCKNGYRGHSCSIRCDIYNGTCVLCAAGFYGDYCTEKCSDKCIGGSCNQSNGECLNGRYGDNSSLNSIHLVVPMLGTIAGGLMIFILASIPIMVIMIKCRRSNADLSAQEPTNDQEMTSPGHIYDTVNMPDVSVSDGFYNSLYEGQELPDCGDHGTAGRPLSNIHAYVNTRSTSNINQNNRL